MKLDRAERLVVSKLTYSEQMRGKTSSNCGTPSAAGGGGGDSLADHDAYIKREILQVRQLLTETFETLKQVEYLVVIFNLVLFRKLNVFRLKIL